jgi:hypothetical protein
VAGSLFFGLWEKNLIIIGNLLILFVCMITVLLLDRFISLKTHVFGLYVMIVSYTVLWLVSMSFFWNSFHILFFVSVCALSLLFIGFPPLLTKTVKNAHFPLLEWHFSNTLMTFSFGALFYFMFQLFFGRFNDLFITILGLCILLGVWCKTYLLDGENPAFFTGCSLVIISLYTFFIFRFLDLGFGWSLLAIFGFSTLLLLSSRAFRGHMEEKILGILLVIFLCISDIVLIVNGYGFFALALVFFFQTVFWYFTYTLFHTHKVPSPHLDAHG